MTNFVNLRRLLIGWMLTVAVLGAAQDELPAIPDMDEATARSLLETIAGANQPRTIASTENEGELIKRHVDAMKKSAAEAEAIIKNLHSQIAHAYKNKKALLNEANTHLGEGPIVGIAATLASTAKLRLFEKACQQTGNGNAFEHAYFSALVANVLDQKTSQRWGDANEAHNDPKELGTIMDQDNNTLGRSLAKGVTRGKFDILEKAVLQALSEGKGTRIVNGKPFKTDATCRK